MTCIMESCGLELKAERKVERNYTHMMPLVPPDRERTPIVYNPLKIVVKFERFLEEVGCNGCLENLLRYATHRIELETGISGTHQDSYRQRERARISKIQKSCLECFEQTAELPGEPKLAMDLRPQELPERSD